VKKALVCGAGVGGHCLPKDSWLLKYGLETYGRQGDKERGREGEGEIRHSPFALRLIPLAREINDGMPGHMLRLIEEGLAEAGRELAGAKVVLLGVSYPSTALRTGLENADDTRNTPAAALAELLLECGAEVAAHDPYVREADWRRVLNHDHQVPLTTDLWQALEGADCAALVTRHREYQGLALKSVRDVMRTPVLVDGRNVFDVARCVGAGFVMHAIGKSHSEA
jgi:UDP-N-acetyl-D-mannosaminuronic acid dehydrogenase